MFVRLEEKLIAGKMVKNCVAEGCKSTCCDTVSFLNSRAMTTVGSGGFGKCGELAIVGTDCLSIVLCAKGILVKIFQPASAMAPTMGISWRKKLNPDAIPAVFERPEPTGMSSVVSDSGDRYFLAVENYGYG